MGMKAAHSFESTVKFTLSRWQKK